VIVWFEICGGIVVFYNYMEEIWKINKKGDHLFSTLDLRTLNRSLTPANGQVF
jgi:hypothetical protein